MTSKTRGILVTALAATALLTSVLPVSASDGPIEDAVALVDDVTHCRAWADEPGGDPVIGWVGANCGAVHRN
ncbi:MAG TPA: hypothetical protein VHJ76_05130, partial [Actinomycetota bacterium]|nr:hypothetical protein [Actinomycetota bacterium]